MTDHGDKSLFYTVNKFKLAPDFAGIILGALIFKTRLRTKNMHR